MPCMGLVRDKRGCIEVCFLDKLALKHSFNLSSGYVLQRQALLDK